MTVVTRRVAAPPVSIPANRRSFPPNPPHPDSSPRRIGAGQRYPHALRTQGNSHWASSTRPRGMMFGSSLRYASKECPECMPRARKRGVRIRTRLLRAATAALHSARSSRCGHDPPVSVPDRPVARFRKYAHMHDRPYTDALRKQQHLE